MLNTIKIYLILLTFIATNVNASLIDYDNYIWDTESDLDWLKLTETQAIPFNHIYSQFGENELYEGWQYASSIQFEELILNFGGIPMVCSGTSMFCGTSIANNGKMAALISLIGETYRSSSTIASNGMISAINSSGAHFVAGISESSSGTVFIDSAWTTNRKQEISSNMGSFLVRQHIQVPEPTTVSMLTLGLIGLVIRRRKRSIPLVDRFTI
jgi:hypothetical protein